MLNPIERVRARVRDVSAAGAVLSTLPVTTETVILTAIMTLAFVMFLLIEPTPRWLALFSAVVAALGTDGVLRTARERIRAHTGTSAPAFPAEERDMTAYLFLPALFALGVPVFAEHHVRGLWAIAAGLGAGLCFGAIVSAAVASARARERITGHGRFVTAAATYFVAFALLSLAYAFDLQLRDAVVAAWLISTLLAVELLRDDEVDPVETLILAAVAGLVMAEARWVLQFMPIDGALAAVTLLLVFYFVTGVIHLHVTRQLNAAIAAEYAAVAAAGVALVAGIRAAGLA
jgi:hypothetical protein